MAPPSTLSTVRMGSCWPQLSEVKGILQRSLQFHQHTLCGRGRAGGREVGSLITGVDVVEVVKTVAAPYGSPQFLIFLDVVGDSAFGVADLGGNSPF